MASLRRLLMQSSRLKRAHNPIFSRQFSKKSTTPSPLKELESRVLELERNLWKTVVHLERIFDKNDAVAGAEGVSRRGTGVFIGPDLILTTARSVGTISSHYVPESSADDAGLERGTIFHKSYIGRIVGSNYSGKFMEMKSVAVNYGCDLAILKVDSTIGDVFVPYARIASSGDDDGCSIYIAHLGDLGSRISFGWRYDRRKSRSIKAPWPLDDKLEWIAHCWNFDGTLWNPLSKTGRDVPGAALGGGGSSCFSIASGSPVFNLNGEIAGIISWGVKGADNAPMTATTAGGGGFVVPVRYIKEILQYAENEGKDSVIMDEWIDAKDYKAIEEREGKS